MNSASFYLITEDDSTMFIGSGLQMDDNINYISVGGGLVLTDDDSVNSPVTVDTVVVEIISGSPVEQLFFGINNSAIQVSSNLMSIQVKS